MSFNISELVWRQLWHLCSTILLSILAFNNIAIWIVPTLISSFSLLYSQILQAHCFNNALQECQLHVPKFLQPSNKFKFIFPSFHFLLDITCVPSEGLLFYKCFLFVSYLHLDSLYLWCYYHNISENAPSCFLQGNLELDRFL